MYNISDAHGIMYVLEHSSGTNTKNSGETTYTELLYNTWYNFSTVAFTCILTLPLDVRLSNAVPCASRDKMFRSYGTVSLPCVLLSRPTSTVLYCIVLYQVRFVLNLPEAELSSADRLFFQVSKQTPTQNPI